MSTDVGTNSEKSSSTWLKALVKAAILLGLGFYFASMVFNDTLKNYSNQPTWLSLGAAVLFTLLGVTSLASFLIGRSKKQEPHYHEEDGEYHDHVHTGAAADIHVEGHEHEHGQTSWAILLIAAIPLALGMLLPSKPLGAAAISGNGDSLNGSNLAIKGNGPSIAEPQGWNIMEWQLANWHHVHPAEWFNGKKVNVVGFVVRQPDVPKSNFLVGRFVMYHCAADAKGVALLVDWPEADKLPSDTWVRVEGTMRAENMGTGPTLHVYATHVDDKIGAPEEPYLRPFLRNDNPGG